ncbi:hypothetical protein ACU4GD_07925 [Cupriavidus basilensis]
MRYRDYWFWTEHGDLKTKRALRWPDHAVLHAGGYRQQGTRCR